MTSVSVQSPSAAVRERSRFERLLAAIPVVALGLCIVTFYAVEAWTRKTPWIFTDELEWTQISRSIESTGHAARRGQPIFFKSIYSFLIAPLWWFSSTGTAYSAIKYLNAFVMSLTAVPTYLLARMYVTRRSAVIVAILSVSVPAMAYATTIIPEVVAYPYYALCSWLVVRGFRSEKRLDLLLAGVVAFGGLLVRSPQFLTMAAGFLIASAGLWITGPRGRELRKNWSRADTIGGFVLLVGALFLFNRVVLQHIHEWQFTTEYYKNRIVDLGLRAGLSFTIGMGILPVIGGFASLRLLDRRGDPAYRAWVAWAGATFVCVSLYTANKAAYLSTNFATLWEERNLIYLAPLMLIGSAMVLESRRVDWRVVTAAAAFVVVIVILKPFELQYPYFEGPGFVIVSLLNTHEHWGVGQMRAMLLGLLAVSLLVVWGRRRRGVAAVATVVLFGWLLTGEIANTWGIDKLANSFRRNMPPTPNWVDQETHGQAVTYLGQDVKDPNGVWLTEFWNRSIQHVDTLDGTGPGPGPSPRPDLLSATGELSGLRHSPYVLADEGVTLQGTVVAKEGAMVLYHHAGPWHLLQAVQQQYSDGWCPGWCSYTYYKPGQKGTLSLSFSRTAYNGSALPGQAHIYVGSVRVDRGKSPQLGHIFREVHQVVPNGREETVNIPVAETPVRVEITFDDSSLIPPSASDPRALGAQMGFSFTPAPGR